jgi:hypothetical protein
MRRRVLAYSLLLMVAWIGSAQAQPAMETCEQLEWDYEPNPMLGVFRLYVSQTSGVYPIVPGDPRASQPLKIIPAMAELVTHVLCEGLWLPRDGVWYAVVTAVSRDLSEESPPSNEISFTYGNTSIVPPPITPPVAPRPPPVVLPPRPPPLGMAPPPKPPPPEGQRTWITQSCVWRGLPPECDR